MKVLQKQDNGLLTIEYFDKISRTKLILKDVNPEVVSEMKKSKRDEEDYRKYAKKHFVNFDDLAEELSTNFHCPEETLLEEQQEKDVRELRYKVYKLMRQFTLRERQVARLRYYEKKSNLEIARELNISEPRTTQITQKIEKMLKNL